MDTDVRSEWTPGLRPATPCREWVGPRLPRGYGRKWCKETKRKVYVHRWVVAQIHGWDALEGKHVMHLCDNPACYRYDHLRIGSNMENVADMKAKGRAPAKWKPIEHGTNRGYHSHYRRGDQPCRPCLDAAAEYQRSRRTR